MVMDRCKRRRNRLKSALGRRRVSQSEDLLRCRFSLSRTVLSRTIQTTFESIVRGRIAVEATRQHTDPRGGPCYWIGNTITRFIV